MAETKAKPTGTTQSPELKATCREMLYVIISINKGHRYRPQYTIVLIIGTPKRNPEFWETTIRTARRFVLLRARGSRQHCITASSARFIGFTVLSLQGYGLPVFLYKVFFLKKLWSTRLYDTNLHFGQHRVSQGYLRETHALMEVARARCKSQHLPLTSKTTSTTRYS